MKRSVYTIWPATKSGYQAIGTAAWRQESRWLVIKLTPVGDQIVAGPMSRSDAYTEMIRLRTVQPPTKVAAL